MTETKAYAGLAVRVAIAVGVLWPAVACATRRATDDSVRQAAAAAIGDSGIATDGPTGGAPPGTGAHRLLSEKERHRSADAARAAFAASGEATTSFTVVPQSIDDEPTIVSAAPAGALENRADGSTCRPLRLSVVKFAQTTVGTLTFCRAPGSAVLNAATSI